MRCTKIDIGCCKVGIILPNFRSILSVPVYSKCPRSFRSRGSVALLPELCVARTWAQVIFSNRLIDIIGHLKALILYLRPLYSLFDPLTIERKKIYVHRILLAEWVTQDTYLDSYSPHRREWNGWKNVFCPREFSTGSRLNRVSYYKPSHHRLCYCLANNSHRPRISFWHTKYTTWQCVDTVGL